MWDGRGVWVGRRVRGGRRTGEVGVCTHSHLVSSQPLLVLQLPVAMGVIRHTCNHLVHLVEGVHLAIE